MFWNSCLRLLCGEKYGEQERKILEEKKSQTFKTVSYNNKKRRQVLKT
jgi:hypothetical protein